MIYNEYLVRRLCGDTKFCGTSPHLAKQYHCLDVLAPGVFPARQRAVFDPVDRRYPFNGLLKPECVAMVREMGFVGAGAGPAYMDTVRYADGKRADKFYASTAPYPPELKQWSKREYALAEYVARRELYRRRGPATTVEAWRQDDEAIALLMKAVAEDPWHVFDGRPVWQSDPDWSAFACFCNWYWWLSPESRASLRADMVQFAKLWTWAYWAIDKALPVCPVRGDQAYANTVVIEGWADAWGHDVQANIGATPAGLKGLSGQALAPWPVVDADGNPVLPQWLPLPAPCSPFPQCLTSLWPAAIPMPAVDAIWQSMLSYVKQNPQQLRMLANQDGGIYQEGPSAPTRPPSPPNGGRPPATPRPQDTVPTTAQPYPPKDTPPTVPTGPFYERHTNTADGCRYTCHIESVGSCNKEGICTGIDKAKDAANCAKYADCIVRADAAAGKTSDPKVVASQCIDAILGRGQGYSLEVSAPETCPPLPAAETSSWWSQNWKYVVAGVVGVAAVGGAIALASRSKRGRLAAAPAEGVDEVSKRIRMGTRVRFVPLPASAPLYTYAPAPGTTGTVTSVPVGTGRKIYLPGPGGGLIYVQWDDGSVVGVSPYDLVMAREGFSAEERVKAEEIPKSQIDHLVGWISVGATDAEVRADIEQRCAKAGARPAVVKACGDYAVKSHHRNQQVYNDVMSGHLRSRRRRGKVAKEAFGVDEYDVIVRHKGEARYYKKRFPTIKSARPYVSTLARRGRAVYIVDSDTGDIAYKWVPKPQNKTAAEMEADEKPYMSRVALERVKIQAANVVAKPNDHYRGMLRKAEAAARRAGYSQASITKARNEGENWARSGMKARGTREDEPDPEYRKQIEDLAWTHAHRDFKGMLGHQRAMLYLNPKTGGTELWPVCCIPTNYLELAAGAREDGGSAQNQPPFSDGDRVTLVERDRAHRWWYRNMPDDRPLAGDTGTVVGFPIPKDAGPKHGGPFWIVYVRWDKPIDKIPGVQTRVVTNDLVKVA